MQKWEYRMLHFSRAAKAEALAGVHHGFEPWHVYDNKAKKWLRALGGSIPYLNELGQQGWELVDVVPLSDRLGQEFAGGTTAQLCYLKRPEAS